MRGRGLWLGVATVIGVCAPGAVALAASGYSVKVKAPGSVKHKQSFQITASGSAKSKAHLVLFLDQNSCSKTYLLEFNKIGAWQRGDSYFQRGGLRSGSKSLWSNTYKVKGHFTVTVTAHAGTHTGTQHVCAYIPSPGGSTTFAHASRTYRVS
jgi:phage-related protein